ncbi:MAG: RIP metalloprotease RseP, partial [Alphaproteobacteria bacterium]|nr:RIP metalloprotease RseP [Alphaproteobacteria bacterium]
MEAALQLIHEYFIPFLVVLGAVVFVHEYGHYWAAKQCGVKVESFSIGFGPELVGWNDKHGTRWKICLLPLGGYVKMYGDADPASSPDEKALHQMTPTDRERAFFYKSVNKRALIVFAGPAANFLFSLLVLCVLFTVEGQPYTPPVVAKLVPGEASEQAGLQLEDKILSINGVGVERFEDIQRLIRLNRGEPVLLNVQRAGTTF